MSQPSLGYKIGSVLWSLLIAAGIIFVAGGLLLPSTKSAKVDWEEVRRTREQEEAAALAAATTMPSTMPATPTYTTPATEPTPRRARGAIRRQELAHMDLAWHIAGAGAAFLALFAIFRPLELAFPAKPKQGFFRPHWQTDLCFLLGQYLLFNGLVFWVLAKLSPWIHVATPGAVRAWVASLNVWVQLLLVILTGDVLIYWAHRVQHRVDFLWRFHSIHHSAEHLDWLAAHREHPRDTIYTVSLINLPAAILAFPLSTRAGLFAFRGRWAIHIHSNFRFRT